MFSGSTVNHRPCGRLHRAARRKHQPNRRVKPVLVVAGVFDVAQQRTNPDANPKLIGGDPPHRVDQPLTEPDGPARQVPHSPARIDIAQREQDSPLFRGDQYLDCEARHLAEDPVKLIPGERLAHRCTVAAARPSIRDRSVCVLDRSNERSEGRPVVTQRHFDRASLLEGSRRAGTSPRCGRSSPSGGSRVSLASARSFQLTGAVKSRRLAGGFPG